MDPESQSESRDMGDLGCIATRLYYCILNRKYRMWWMIVMDEPPVPGHLIALDPDDFAISTRPPVVRGDLPLQTGRLLVIRYAERGHTEESSLSNAFDITVVGSVKGMELEILGIGGIRADAEFAIRRDGVRLGPEDARVDYSGMAL